VDGYRAAATAVEAEAGMHTRVWEGEIKNYEAGQTLAISTAKLNADVTQATNAIRMDAAKVGAQVYAQLTASAYSMINATAQVSASANMGVSFAEVGANVATFTRLGVSAEQAITGIAGVLRAALKPASEQGKEALAEAAAHRVALGQHAHLLDRDATIVEIVVAEVDLAGRPVAQALHPRPDLPAPLQCSAHTADKHATSRLFVTGLRGHTAEVTGLAWSPDGTQLATACDDRTVRVFNLSDPTAKSIPFRSKELRVGVQDVAFGEDSQHVAVQVRPGKDPALCQPQRQLRGRNALHRCWCPRCCC
jgi:hypothetical protein